MPTDSKHSDTTTKIKDGCLRKLAEESSDESVSVIIELDIPAAIIEFESAKGSGRHFNVPVRAMKLDASAAKSAEESTSEAAKMLERILGRSANYLSAADAFSADATGKQLLEISASQLVKAIRPNRHLKQ